MGSHTTQNTKGIGAKSKNGFIELCRFVFMLGIVSHHAMFLSDDPGYIPIWGGYISVEFFFILTGYFMYASCSRRPLVEDEKDSAIYQVLHKFKKFYPYFFISWCTVFIMLHIESGNANFRVFIWDFIFGIPQLLFLQCAGLAGTGGNYNGTMWFASALMMGILIVYPLMRLGKKYFVTAIAPALSLICYGYVMKIGASLGSVNEWAGPFQAGCLRAIGGLCLGSVCCYIVDHIPRHHLTKHGDTLASLFQLGLVVLILFLMARTYGYTDIIQVILFGVLIIISFAEDTAVNQFFNKKVFFALGRFSMIIFVTQSVAYAAPSLLFYPESWGWRYITYIVYVMFFSLLNYSIVKNIRQWCTGIMKKMRRALLAPTE